MKQTQVMLTLAVLATGILVAGCQMPWATPDTESSSVQQSTNGSIEITPAGEKDAVNGSITIQPPAVTEVDTAASVTIMEAEEAAETSAAEAMEEGRAIME